MSISNCTFDRIWFCNCSLGFGILMFSLICNLILINWFEFDLKCFLICRNASSQSMQKLQDLRGKGSAMKMSQISLEMKASLVVDDSTLSSSSSTSLVLLLRFQRLLFSKLYSLHCAKGLISNPGVYCTRLSLTDWLADCSVFCKKCCSL